MNSKQRSLHIVIEIKSFESCKISQLLDKDKFLLTKGAAKGGFYFHKSIDGFYLKHPKLVMCCFLLKNRKDVRFTFIFLEIDSSIRALKFESTLKYSGTIDINSF